MGANKKISDLTSGSAIGGTEELPIVQSGSTVKTTINTIKTFFDSIYTTTSAVATTLLGYVKKGTLTTNYIPKATASDTIGDSNIYDDGTNVGIGATSPTSKLHIQGIDATSTNYALKVDNSASSPLLYVRNDGVSAFTSAFDGAAAGNPNYSYETTLGGLLVGYNAQNNTAFNFYKNSLLRATIINNDGYFSVSPKYRLSLKTLDDNKSHIWFDSDGNVGIGNDYFSSAAQLHVQGINTSSGAYALKVDNSTNSPLLYVRNDGIVNIGGLTPSQRVETDANKNLISVPKGTAENKNFGTGTSDIVEIGSTLGNNLITSTDANGKLQTLDTVTYPSLTELSYAKGVTSSIQTQIDGKLTATNNLSDLPNPLTARNNLKEWDLIMTTGNQSTTSNIATNITDLVSTTLTANKRYMVHGRIKVGCNNTGGVKFKITLPTGASMDVSLSGSNTSNTTYINTTITASATLSASVQSFNGSSILRIDGEILMGSTTGVIQFGFASGTNTQTSTVYQLGTHITLKQLD